MSTIDDALDGAAGGPRAAAAPGPMPWTRVLYWSVRRELWENRAVVIAPVAVGAIAFVAVLLSTVSLPHAMTAIEAGDVKRADRLMGGHSFLALSVMLSGLVVSAFYSLGALGGERRDRSLLFWKSLPVSDLMTVASKAAVPIAVTPILTCAIVMAAQALILAWTTLIVGLSGHSLPVLWRHEDLGLMWVVLPYGLLVNAIWQAPIHAWFLLVSGWAKRMAIVWAIAPFAAAAILERGALGTSHLAGLASGMVFGGFGEAFSVGGKGEAPIESLGQVDPARVLSQPYFWIAPAVAVLLIWIAARRRRSATPL
jgi:ABC-2 type transport system permease protein